MKKTFSFLILVIIFIASFTIQKASATFAPGYTRDSLTSLTYDTLAGATIVTAVTAGSADDGAIYINLPFAFKYNGTNYTRITACTNGWIAMDSIFMATFAFTPNLFTTGAAPINTIAAWFRDANINTAANGMFVHAQKIVGSDTAYVIEYRNFSGASGGGTSSTLLYNCQVWLYKTSNKIEIRYGSILGAITTSAAIGIKDDGVGAIPNYYNALTNNSTSTTLSSAWGGNGNGYRYNPIALASNNVGTTAKVAPGNIGIGSATVAPKATFKNFGTANQLVPFGVTYKVTGAKNWTSNKTDTISAGLSNNVTFDSTFVPDTLGVCNVTIYTSLASDADRSNDTLKTSFTITPAPLAGDYTVGVLLFNRITGKNITFKRVVNKVMREVFVEDRDVEKMYNKEELASVNSPHGKYIMKEVEEVSFVPMENGREYTGSLSATREDYPNIGTDAGVGVYATVTAAVNDLNLRGSSAAVRFLLLDATYPSETFPIIINNATASAVNTLTIKPNTAVTSTISGASSNSVIFKILSSWTTIDGSNAVAGTTRDLTMENTSITTPSVIWIGSTGTTPIKNCTLKNNIIRNGVNTSSAVVLSDGATLGTAGYSNNITYQNNSVEKAYIGLYSINVVAAGNGSGHIVISNSINTAGVNSVRFIGVYVQGIDGANVTQNDIGNFDGTSSEDDKGVWYATGTVNSTIQRNAIHDLAYTGTGGYGGHGIYVSSGTTACGDTVKNNMIYKISGDGFSYTGSFFADNPVGIVLIGAQTGVGVFYNSIYLSGNTLNQTSALSMGMLLGTGSVASIKDNILQNNLGLAGATGYGSTGIYAQTSNAQFTDINYNDYYTNPTGSGVKLVGQIAASASANLAAWKTATGQDVSSISGDPLYISTTNLHIDSLGSSPCSNAGTPIAGITNDYDGNTRNAVTPDIGADEFNSTGGPVSNVAVTAILVPLAGVNILSGPTIAPQATIQNVGTVNQTTPFPITCKINPGGYTSTLTDTLSVGVSRNKTFANFSPSVNVTYTVTVYTSLASDANRSNDTLTQVSSFIFQNSGNDSGYFYANSLATTLPSYPKYTWKDTTGSISLVDAGANVSALLVGSLDDGYFPLSLKDILLALGQDTTDRHIKYNGVCYDSIFPGTNGIVGLTAAYGAISISTFTVDGINVANNALLPLWHDFNLGVLGSSPSNRLSYKAKGNQLIITYAGVTSYAPTTDWVSFQVVVELVSGCGGGNSNFRYTYADTTTGQTSGSFVSNYLAQYPAATGSVTTFRNHVEGFSENGAPIAYGGFCSPANTFGGPNPLNVKRPIYNLATNRGLAVEFGPNANSLNEGDALILKVSIGIQGLEHAPTASERRVRDTVEIIIRDGAAAPYKVFQKYTVFLDSAYNGSFSYGYTNIEFSLLKRGYPYYIEIRNRKTLESWSNATSTAGDTLKYNFTSSLSQIFGSNGALENGIPTIYSGDVTSTTGGGFPYQDGFIDLADVIAVYNDAAAFAVGPDLITDLNWDGLTDLTDLIIVYNNSSNFVQKVVPAGAVDNNELISKNYSTEVAKQTGHVGPGIVIPDTHIVTKEQLERGKSNGSQK